jgi:hypothetical protein
MSTQGRKRTCALDIHINCKARWIWGGVTMEVHDPDVECCDPYTREEFERDRARLLTVIATKHCIAEREVPALIAEHRYEHSFEDVEDAYIQTMEMGRAAGWVSLCGAQ